VSEENYTYDAMGRLIGATDSDGNALGFDYDSFNRLLAETENGKNVSYTYDSNSNPLSILYPSGKKVEKSYDALNRLLGVNLAGETVASYSYNSLFPENLSYSNGTQTTYSFDGLARLSTLTTTLIGNSGKSADGSNKSETLSYDPIGNILSDGMNSYVYDTLSRITGAGYPGVRGGGDSKEREEGRNSGNQILRSEAWTYDPVGSRVQSVETITKDQQKKEDKDNANKVQTTTYTTNPLNQYLTA
jgi:YD repeat-containing protein